MPALFPLLSAHGCLHLSPSHPHSSVSVYSPICLPVLVCPSLSSLLPPTSAWVSTLPALCSLADSMMKSWIQATFLCFLAWHLVPTAPLNG